MRMRKKKHLEERLEACRENQIPLCEHEADFRKAADKPCYLNFKAITERVTGSLYSYIVEPAVAMSGIYRSNQRIQSDTGIVKEIRETDRGFYLIIQFDE